MHVFLTFTKGPNKNTTKFKMRKVKPMLDKKRDNTEWNTQRARLFRKGECQYLYQQTMKMIPLIHSKGSTIHTHICNQLCRGIFEFNIHAIFLLKCTNVLGSPSHRSKITTSIKVGIFGDGVVVGVAGKTQEEYWFCRNRTVCSHWLSTQALYYWDSVDKGAIRCLLSSLTVSKV